MKHSWIRSTLAILGLLAGLGGGFAHAQYTTMYYYPTVTYYQAPAPATYVGSSYSFYPPSYSVSYYPPPVTAYYAPPAYTTTTYYYTPLFRRPLFPRRYVQTNVYYYTPAYSYTPGYYSYYYTPLFYRY